MIFIETENLNLKVPSKTNLSKWSQWINSPILRSTISSNSIPQTIEMQWDWIENELKSKKRILLEICNKVDDTFLGVLSLSSIDYKKRSAQIATISPFQKNKKNTYCVYESRRAILNYAFNELSLNKVYGAMYYPENKSFMVNNMCLGFEIEGIIHDCYWVNNEPKIGVNYFITRSIFDRKEIKSADINNLLSKKNRSFNEKKLSEIISYIQVK